MPESWCTVSPPVLDFEISKKSTQLLTARFTRPRGFLKLKTSNPNVIKFVKDVFPFTESIREVQVQVVYHPEFQIDFQENIKVFIEELAVNGLETVTVPIKLYHPSAFASTPTPCSQNQQNLQIPTCKICMEEYSQQKLPRILSSCGHTVCQNCAESLLNLGELVCPFDRKTTLVRSIDQLLTNFSILEMLGEENGGDPDVENKFEFHCIENSNHEAVWHCQTCDADFCDRCFGAAHSLKVLSGHKKIPTSDKPIQLPKCRSHPDLPAEFFCSTDKAEICKQCVETNHQGHFYEDFATKLKTDKEKQKIVKVKLQEKLHSLQVEITRVTGCANSFSESHPVFRDNLSLISDFFESNKLAAVEKFKQFGKEQREKCEKEKEQLEGKVKSTKEELLQLDKMEFLNFDSIDVYNESIVSLLDRNIKFPEDLDIRII